MKQTYLNLILLIERLHRRFLDVIKAELDRLKIEDINNVQTLILYNIGTENLTIGELTVRGYYLGSNVSYNIKKLVENEYLVQERSSHDKRSFKIKLAPKGLVLIEKIDALYRNNVEQLEGVGLGNAEMQQITKQLKQLENFWTGVVGNGLTI